jgi:hypothetical protein
VYHDSKICHDTKVILQLTDKIELIFGIVREGLRWGGFPLSLSMWRTFFETHRYIGRTKAT